MVLVDTAQAAEGLIEESQPGFDEVAGEESYTADMLHCASLASHGSFDPSSAEFKFCSATLPSDNACRVQEGLAAVLHRAPTLRTRPHSWRRCTHIGTTVADHQRLGAMPLVVLTADNSLGVDTPAGIRFWRTYKKAWYARDEALTHLSSRGTHRLIKDSRHHIQLDQPQAVIDAVDEVLGALSGSPGSSA